MKTQVQTQIREQRVVGRSETQTQSWASFPQPQGWSMEWDEQGLNHNAPSSRGRDNNSGSQQG